MPNIGWDVGEPSTSQTSIAPESSASGSTLFTCTTRDSELHGAPSFGEDSSYSSLSEDDGTSQTDDVYTSSSDTSIQLENMYAQVFERNYKDIKCFEHISGVSAYSAVNKWTNLECNLFVVPYSIEDYWKYLELKTLDCPYLLKYSRLQVIGSNSEPPSSWSILLEEPAMKSLIRIFDEFNPDYGMITNVPRRDLDEQTIADILGNILQALQVIHRKGYVHTCVRAESIFSDPNGNMVLGNLHMTRRPNEMSMNVPLAHMAPEMIASIPNLEIKASLRKGIPSSISYAADSWGVGILCYELINLTDMDEYLDVIFPQLPNTELAVKILKKELPKIDTLEKAHNRRLSPELKHFVACCLDANPANRWSAQKLYEEHPFLETS